jgi:hypothetical protein
VSSRIPTQTTPHIYTALSSFWCPHTRYSSTDGLTAYAVTRRWRQNPFSNTILKNRTMDNFQKDNNCIKIPSLSTISVAGVAIWSQTNFGYTGRHYFRSGNFPRISTAHSVSAIFKCILVAVFCERLEVFTAVTMKNGVFWDVTPCGSCKSRRFGGTKRLLHQGYKHR